MPRVLIVSYDLVNPGQNYEALLKKIKNVGAWARLGGSAYLVLTDQEPVNVRDSLMTVLDANDKLYVGVAPAPSAWYKQPEDVAKWILGNQK